MIVTGLMAGTSLDGIDAAVAELTRTGDLVELRPLGHVTTPYAAQTRDLLVAALPPARVDPRVVAEIDAAVGQEFADAAAAALARFAPAGSGDGAGTGSGTGSGSGLVVSHGQTFYHLVEEDGEGLAAWSSVQLGQPAWIAEATGLPVVADVRARDIAAGGQGAPLASTLDVLLLRGLVDAAATSDAAEASDGAAGGPAVAALNIGGIANVTVVGPEDAVAYDIGPGNALLDLTARRLGLPGGYDEDGALAASGTVREPLLERMLADPWFDRVAPKSTGKERFHAGWLEEHLGGAPGIPEADLMATLTELTARTIARALSAHRCTDVYVSGGGAANPELLRRLAAGWGGAVHGSSELGLPEDAKEAYLMALLGFLTWHGAPATVPSCTGARHPSLLGAITPGAGPLRLPEPWPTPPTSLTIQPAHP